MLHNHMEGCWKIVDFENGVIERKETFNKKWGVNSPKAAEAATILDTLEHVNGSTGTHLEGQLIVINDKKITA